MATRSQMASTTLIWWVMTTTVMPSFWLISRIRERMERVVSGSRALVEEGAVQEIFARPKTAAARRLVAPGGGKASRELASFAPDDHVIRLTFNGSSTSKPLVASLAAETGILVSVLSADTRDLNDQCFGSMMLRLPRDVSEARRAVDYIKVQPGVTVEEVTGL